MKRERKDVGKRLSVALYQGRMHQVLVSTQGHCRVGLQGLLQDGKPLEQGVPSGFVGTHLNSLAGMPEHLLVVDHAIEVQVEDYVRAAGRGGRNVEGMVLGGHGLFGEREDACAYENVPD